MDAGVEVKNRLCRKPAWSTYGPELSWWTEDNAPGRRPEHLTPRVKRGATDPPPLGDDHCAPPIAVLSRQAMDAGVEVKNRLCRKPAPADAMEHLWA
ncbi:hypothetical protein DIPPA_10371 [Diplonema papillatum]|nr:hypothetical protein DIPPA_10371 [Diplonema papillatum]